MRSRAVPVENLAEIIWGALLIIYLLGSGQLLAWPVAAVFALSGAAALLELALRRREWPFIDLYDAVVWTVLLAAMVAVTGGRTSEAWPAYIMMSLTAPSLGRPALHYGLMALNAAVYIGVAVAVNPTGAPFVPTLLLLRIGLFFLVTYVVDRLMLRAAKASRDRVGELVSARDAERKRIAGEIHDWLGAGLIAPMRRLELALRAPDPAAARARVTEAIEALRGAHDELRRIMEELHPHLLEQMGLTEALRAYCQAWGEAEVTFEGDAEPEPPAPVALAVYRILQEALTNAARHGGAQRVKVTLRLTQHQCNLTVSDDGAGFAATATAAKAGGRGLQGMRERAEAFGGTLQIESHPTTVTATIPWA